MCLETPVVCDDNKNPWTNVEQSIYILVVQLFLLIF